MAAEETNIPVIREGTEQEVSITREPIQINQGGGAVNSVNGQTGDVVLDAADVGALPDSTVIPTVNDATLTIQKNGSTVATFSANSASDQTANVTVPTSVTDLSDANDYAKAADLEAETAAREGADTGLQSQIDAISASSDVTDIVGTYADLQSYDTSTLGNNDIIKVLQDESRNDETTYYRWSTTTQVFTLIGEEGPYYTKSAADTKFQGKLSPGANIAIDANNEISATDTTYNDFTGTDGSVAGTSGLVPAPATTDADKFLKSDGTWAESGGGGGPTVVQELGTSTANVMSQNAVRDALYQPNTTSVPFRAIQIGAGTHYSKMVTNGAPIAIGDAALIDNQSGRSSGVAIGGKATIANTHEWAVALGYGSASGRVQELSVGGSSYLPSINGVRGRYIANVLDPDLPQDAATKNYVDKAIISGGTTAPTTSTVGSVGTLYAYVDNGAGKLAICTDNTGGTYTWSPLI